MSPLSYIKLGLVAILIIGYLPAMWYYYEKGKNVQFQVCEAEKFEAYQLGSESRKEIDIDVQRLTVNDVIHQLDSINGLRD